MYTRLLDIGKIPPYQSLFLFGARGTGKSTLVRQYLKQTPYASLCYDLLKHDDYLRLHANPSLLRAQVMAELGKGEGPLQIHVDEVQKVPALLDEVHHLIEAAPKQLRFILSGSSARKLKHGGANLLAGRAWQRSLYPLTALEMGADVPLAQTLQFGSLPAVTELSNEMRGDMLQAYTSTYLKEEIQQEVIVRQLDAFHRFLEVAALCNGKMVNFSDIAREAAISRQSVTAYYEILEDTLVGFFLSPWGRHRSRKELVSHGKFYFFDLGVVSALSHRLSLPIEAKTFLFGEVFEHFIVLEFCRLHNYLRTEHRLGFFRTRAGAEVDLIDERHDRLRAIEIKGKETPSGRDASGLRAFAEEFPEAETLIVCTAPRPFQLGAIRCLPWRDFLEEEWRGGGRS